MGRKFSKESNMRIDCRPLNITAVKELLFQSEITINTIFWRTVGGDNQQTTFLHAAIKKKNVKLIDWLLAQKVNPNIEVPGLGLPIIVAISKNDLDTVRKLVAHGARLNFRDSKSGASVLYEACIYSNTRIIKFLIQNGADVNLELAKSGSFNGHSPLQFFAERGNLEITKLILSKGGKVNHESPEGLRPIICAAQRGHLEVVKLLINYGADINIVYSRNSDIVTLLHAAILSRKVEVLEFLCNLDEAATDVNILTQKKKKTLLQYELNPLFYRNSIVTFLLEAGFDVNAEDVNGKLAVEYVLPGYEIEKNDLLIKKHLMKLISADLPVCKKNKDAVGEELGNFAAECSQEIEILKNSRFSEANVNFYDVLQLSTHKLTLKIKRYQIKLTGMSRKYLKEFFPLYGGMLALKLAKAQRRMALLVNAEEELMKIFNSLKLPYVFLRELFCYLNNCDLKRIKK